MSHEFETIPMESAIEGWLEETRGRGGRAASGRGRMVKRPPRRRRPYPRRPPSTSAANSTQVSIEPPFEPVPEPAGDPDAPGADSASSDAAMSSGGGEPLADADEKPSPDGSPDEGSEFEAWTQGGPIAARLTGWRRVPFGLILKVLKPGAGGLYIVELDGKPIYVGEASDLARRWRGRLLNARQIGLFPPPGSGVSTRLFAWFATIEPNRERERRAAEHAAIRTLINFGLAKSDDLRNSEAKKQFAVKATLKIRGLLPPDYLERVKRGRAAGGQYQAFYKRNTLDMKTGSTYETRLWGGGAP